MKMKTNGQSQTIALFLNGLREYWQKFETKIKIIIESFKLEKNYQLKYVLLKCYTEKYYFLNCCFYILPRNWSEGAQ